MYKIFFFFLTSNSIFMIISSNSWLSMYIGLELNLLSFIPLIYNKKSSHSLECMMKYFLIQVVASSILLFSLIINYHNSLFMNLLIYFSLMLKMGMAPLHFWLPEVMEGLPWFNCFIIATMQKIAPMTMLMNINNNNFTMNFIIMMSIMLGGLLGLNQISLRKMMAFSSITHMGWMLPLIFLNSTIWVYYFLTYTIISFNIMFFCLQMNSFFINHLNFKLNNFLKLIFSMNFISLGGLPPLLGFFPKWLTIKILIMNNYMFISLFMLIFTLVTMYFYMKFSLNFFSNQKNYSFMKKSISFYILLVNIISLLSLTIMTFSLNLL